MATASKKPTDDPPDNPIVDAVWEGPDVFVPRMGTIVKLGDTIRVTAEQADDPNTPAARKAAAKSKES